MRAECALCEWTNDDYLTYDMAGCRSSWHVYEAHRDVWVEMFGDRPPLDPDPRWK